MDKAKLFINGKSQAVRLPKAYRFSGDEVYIKKIGDMVLLLSNKDTWQIFLNGLEGFSPDFYCDPRTDVLDNPRETL